MRPVIDAFLNAGINCMYPMEPAAGLDIVEVRQKHSDRLAFYGGIDKHVIRQSQAGIVEELEKKLPYYAERHMVKPGLTGWAQINYPYGASVEDARVKLEYDLYYAKNYSPFLDLLILLQTVRVVLWPEGAR